MSNNYFSFKQFTIHQDDCAMKVCTDSCLFGAIVAQYLPNRNKALDIGSGTGLLSLMYAQKNAATIDAVELDENAFIQSQQNIAATSFANTINTFHQNIINFATEKRYDLVFSNPPFFKSSLKSNDEARNLAMHNDALSYKSLIKKVVMLLDVNGFFAVLIPYYAKDEFISIANNYDLILNKSFDIKQTTTHHFFRTILFFSFAKKEIEPIEIAIKDHQNNYSEAFVDLLKDYYLFL